ncbi:MAG: bifunctional metallophosphatase/5'-nucleotidase [Bacteroidetes bacterium]|nr:bifunctional metallophosphatase/5'-nucleotidase [Bacteroidota bacterium]
MKNYNSILIILSVLLAVYIKPVNAQRKPVEILILHTNDMHAKIDNLGKLAYFADSLRKTHKFVYLVSAGDNFTGNPVVDMIEDKGYPMIDLMNRCGYDVSAMGNHEFDLGQDKLNARMLQATFPFISCNIDASQAEVKQMKPYIILKAGRRSIPMLGIIELGPNGLPDSHPSKMKGLTFTDGLKKAEEYSWLKKKYGMLIGLTHLGVETDSVLAQKMPEFDVLIGGHSHTTLSHPMMVNNVMIVQTGSSLKYVGVLTLHIQHGKIIDRKDVLVPLSSIAKSDPVIQALIDKYNDNPELNKVVAEAEEDITGKSELGSMMTDAITQQMKVDFAFQNTGGIRVPLLPKGDIKLKDLYRLDPFANLIVIYKMNLQEIKSLICTSFNRSKEIDMEVSGLKYTVRTNAAGQCADVDLVDLSGAKLDPLKEYSVGINSYIAAAYKWDHRDEGNTTYTTCAQALIEYLKVKKKVNYKGVKRSNVRPVE